MNKHTPGPWIVDKCDYEFSIFVPSTNGLRYVIARDIGGEVHKDPLGNYTDFSTVVANVSLICAAPDLLESAINALEIAESWIHDQLDGTSGLDKALSALDSVRATIAKATGSQP